MVRFLWIMGAMLLAFLLIDYVRLWRQSALADEIAETHFAIQQLKKIHNLEEWRAGYSWGWSDATAAREYDDRTVRRMRMAPAR